MVSRKTTSLEKILEHLEAFDADNLTILVQRLAREQSLLETVFNVIREGILVIDQKGLIEYANEAAETLLSFERDAIGKETLWKLLPDLRRTLEMNDKGDYIGQSSISREFDLSYPEWRTIRLYLVPFEYHLLEKNKEASEHFAIILSDITREKLSTEQQIENEKITSLFHLAAGVAHELGNPLNSLTIHLQLMQRQIKNLSAVDTAKEEKLKKSLDVALSEVERLDGIINNFLQAIRPQRPNLSDVDLMRALEEVIELQSPELADAGVKVDISISETLPIVSADYNQIKQVYFNLIKNAREAIDKTSGTIKVEARSDDKYVYIAIGDTGKGIKKEHLSKVFRPYFTTKKEGHGLGMMIVQKIMDDHGGQIGIDSHSGVGTVVTLQFPKKHQKQKMLYG